MSGASHSLRGRLLAMLMAVIGACWLAGLCGQYLQLSGQQDGYWDRGLKDAAEQILLSMPRDIASSRTAAHLQLPAETAASAPGSLRLHKLSFQVWILARRESVVTSAYGPAQPLQPDFANGYTHPLIDGKPWRVYAVTDASGQVQVQVGSAEAQLRGELLRQVTVLLASTVLILPCLGAGVWLVIRWSLKPVNRVREAIAARPATDLAPLPHEDLPEEVRPLVVSFNGLLARLDQALQSERQFLADAAHELRTPLAVLLAQTQVALHADSLERAREALARLVLGIERAARLAQQLLDSARVDAERPGRPLPAVELAQVATMVAHEFGQAAARKQQTIALDTAPGAVRGDLDELGILLRNLVDNALRYGEPGGRVEIACRHDAVAGTVTLSVRDDGPGVAAEERERVFERFFRGSSGNGERGSGIGLSLVARIARVHGAALRAGSGIGGHGFGVSVEFPAVTEGEPA